VIVVISPNVHLMFALIYNRIHILGLERKYTTYKERKSFLF